MITADAAYDTLAFYETANTRGTTVVVPPAKTAKLSQRNPRSSARDGTIRKISRIGRRRWKKEIGYHGQARVENAFFRYKVDSRRSTSKSDSRSASCRIGACVQCAQSNDRAWSTRVVRDRSVTNLRVGALGASFDCRVAPGDCSPEALTRTGLGGFHHPALPLMWLMAMRPQIRTRIRGTGVHYLSNFW